MIGQLPINNRGLVTTRLWIRQSKDTQESSVLFRFYQIKCSEFVSRPSLCSVFNYSVNEDSHWGESSHIGSICSTQVSPIVAPAYSSSIPLTECDPLECFNQSTMLLPIINEWMNEYKLYVEYSTHNFHRRFIIKYILYNCWATIYSILPQQTAWAFLHFAVIFAVREVKYHTQTRMVSFLRLLAN